MSSWVGFTDRLRRHGRSIDVKPTTRGYINVAADRIDDLESKLAESERKLREKSIALDRKLGWYS